MPGDRADGDGMTFPAPDPFKENGHMLVSPIRVSSLADDNIGGFDEGPFEILVGLLSQPTMSDLPAATFYGGNCAGIAGKAS